MKVTIIEFISNAKEFFNYKDMSWREKIVFWRKTVIAVYHLYVKEPHV